VNPKKLLKDLERALKQDPDNLVLRLKVAAALREVGRRDDAVAMYRSVAVAYHKQGRLAQAIAVCKSVLEIEPSQRETQALLAELDAARQSKEAVPPFQAAELAPPGTRPRRGTAPPPRPPTPGSIPALQRLQPVTTAGKALEPPPLPPASGTGMTPMPSIGQITPLPPEELPVGPRLPLQAQPSGPVAVQPPPPESPRTLPARPVGRTTAPPPMGPPPASTPAPERLMQPVMTSPQRPRALAGPARSPARPTVTPQPGVPVVSGTGTGEPTPAPAGRRKRPSQQAMTPTPLPPPMPHTPTPADSGMGRLFQPPYVPVPGQDDEGKTLPTIRPKLNPAPAVQPGRRRAAEDTAPPPTAGADEATRIADEPGVGVQVGEPEPEFSDEDNATRVADSQPDMDDVELRASDDLHEGPLLEEGESQPTVRRLPEDLAQYSRSNRLLDVRWPEVKTSEDIAEEIEPEPQDATDVGATPRAGRRMPVPPPPPVPPISVPPATPARPGPPKVRVTKPRVSQVGPMPTPLDDAATGKVERLDADEISIRSDQILSVESGDDTGVSRDPSQDEDEEDSLELARAFDRSFVADLGELAPDGSVIDRSLPLFARLSKQAMAELERRMSFRRCAAGDLILREGDPGDACYVIHSGSVRVLKRDPSGGTGDMIEIARMGAGALFGEFALLADRRRHASVQALEACELYEISRRLLRELAAEYSDVGPELERFYRERLLATLLATAPFFQPLPEEERAALMQRFVPRHVDAGTAIIREGEAGGGLYLIVLGTVDITRRPDGGRRVVPLATLGEGAYFGEMSLLSGGKASATVTAAGPVELAQLSPRDFYEIVAAYPVIWDELRREAHRRELLNQNILAGETQLV
jgi:CRP-like cAMP-binding protein